MLAKLTLASLYLLLYLGDLLTKLKRSSQVRLFKLPMMVPFGTSLSFLDGMIKMFYFSRRADTGLESHQSGGLHIRYGC